MRALRVGTALARVPSLLLRLRLRLSLLRIAANIVAMACVRPLRPLRPVRPLPVAPARSLDIATGLLPGHLRRLSRGFCAASFHDAHGRVRSSTGELATAAPQGCYAGHGRY